VRESRKADKGRRKIRSYVLRQGRLTPAQKRALDELWPRYGIEPGPGPLDFADLFERQAPVIVEVGFGNGEALAEMAHQAPETDFLGIEVHQPGIGRLLRQLDREGIGNVRVAASDAVEFLRDRVADATLAGVRIWFPDPWPKKRHHKRRLIQAPFVQLLARKMAPGAILHLATDWVPYAEHMLEVLGAAPAFENLSPTGDYCDRPSWRPLTRFEKRGERLGHETRDLLFRRLPEQTAQVG
jgi:tRNA (guanine-N7-)-methyltransferase